MDKNVVSLNASYYELVMQDKVLVTMKAEEKGTDRKKIIQSLKEKVVAVQKLFKTKKLSVQVSSQQVSEEYSNVKNEWKKTGKWQAVAHLQVIAYDFELINKLVDEVTEQDLVTFESAVTSISEKTKQEKEKEFTSKAIAKFREKASNIGKAFEAEKYDIVSVDVQSASDERGGGYRGVVGAAALSMSPTGGSAYGEEGSVSSYISPREEKISITVSGSIQLF